MAPDVRKEGLRAIFLWNEINSEISWEGGETGWRYSADDYGRALGNFVKEAKNVFGDIPILFKTGGGDLTVYG